MTNEIQDPDYTPMTKEEIVRLAKLFAKPIDFDSLVEQGVLERKGKWYAILDMERLPEHARRKMIAAKTPNLVRFSKAKDILK